MRLSFVTAKTGTVLPDMDNHMVASFIRAYLVYYLHSIYF